MKYSLFSNNWIREQLGLGSGNHIVDKMEEDLNGTDDKLECGCKKYCRCDDLHDGRDE